MNSFKIAITVMAVTLMSSLLLTCKKENVKSVATDQEVAFAINISNLKNAPALKSAMDYNLSNAASLILTIQTVDGSPTPYTSSVIKIQQMNGVYYTQTLVLKTGPYKLTYFVLTDSAGNTIFASPLTGSREAQNVANPLPIEFSVSTNASASVDVEVLSTEALTPDDFGLVTFPIIEVKTFSFLIGVADKESHKLLTAKLTVSNSSYSYIQNLDSIANNVVTVKDSLSQYTLKIEKTGYITYIHSYPIDSLKMFKNLPLLIELEKELTVTDIDGNVYHTITIGTQVWIVENLKVTHYRNGDAIPNATDNSSWTALSTGAYCWYNNDLATFKNTYGAIYNWYAVADIRNIAPLGWHVPNDADWTILTDYLGGIGYAGGKMKETGTAHWQSPNTGATNESGFTALPGGYRHAYGWFSRIGEEAQWWSLTEINSSYAYNKGFGYDHSDFGEGYNSKSFGFSVRCVKN